MDQNFFSFRIFKTRPTIIFY